MKYTVTSNVRGIHAMFECMILFCRANDPEAAGNRFVEIFKGDTKYLTIKEGWDFKNREAQELFSQKAMETLEKDFSPGLIYQELFGRLQRNWNAFPHYGFEYGEVDREKRLQDKLKDHVCTKEDPAPARDGRGWPYVKTWNTKFCHPDAVQKPFEDTDSTLYTCPHCQASWIYESDQYFEEARQQAEDMRVRLEKIKTDGINSIRDKIKDLKEV